MTAVGIVVGVVSGCAGASSETPPAAPPPAVVSQPAPAPMGSAPTVTPVADTPTSLPAEPAPRELPVVNLEPGVTYEGLKAALGKPDEIDRETLRNGVYVRWGRIEGRPDAQPEFQVEATFRGDSIQRRVPVGLDVRDPFPGTLHGLSLGGEPEAAGLKKEWSEGIGPASRYMLSHEEEGGVVKSLSVWKDGVVVRPIWMNY